MRTDDRVQHIAQIFNEVNRTYFDGVIPVPTFRLSTRLTHTAGWVTYDDWTMAISAPYHDHYDWEDELVDTIKHEAIHLYLAYSFRPSGHTKEFKALSQQIGATHYGKAMPRRRPHYRYYKTCSHCGGQSVSGSWRPDAACGACCEAYNGGRYTPQFKLTLLKRERLPLPVPAEGSSAAELEQPAAPPRPAEQLPLFTEDSP